MASLKWHRVKTWRKQEINNEGRMNQAALKIQGILSSLPRNGLWWKCNYENQADYCHNPPLLSMIRLLTCPKAKANALPYKDIPVNDTYPWVTLTLMLQVDRRFRCTHYFWTPFPFWRVIVQHPFKQARVRTQRTSRLVKIHNVAPRTKWTE